MSLDIALTMRFAREGETKMLEETSAGIQKVDQSAKGASTSVGGLAEGMRQTASEAPKASAGVEDLGETAAAAGGKFDQLKTLGIAAIGGIAGAFVAAGIDLLFAAAMGAATAYFDEVTNSAANLEDDLNRHQDLVGDIKGYWERAAGAASDYGLKSRAILQFEAGRNVERLSGDLDSSVGRLDRGLIDRGRDPMAQGRMQLLGAPVASPLKGVIDGLKADLADGRADIIRWRDEVSAVLNTLPADSPLQKWGEEFMAATSEAAELQAELTRAIDLFKAMNGDAAAAATAMGSVADKMTATGSAAAQALPALAEYDERLQSIRGGPNLPSAPQTDPSADGNRMLLWPFASGGYTGHAPTDKVAGFVHGQEFVFDAATTRAIGADNLEAIRRGVRGYASGGFVGSAPAATSTRGWDGMASDLQAARGAVRDFADELWQARSPIEALASVVKSASQSYLNRALGAVGDAVENLLFPGYALGTPNHAGGLALVGERGPELVNLPRGAQVIPNGQSMAMLGGSTVNNFFVQTPSPRAFAESRSSVARAAGRLTGAAQRHS